MLNWVLAAIAAALWSTAYGWYFSPDIRHWFWLRRNRKRLAEIERARAYAAWMRRAGPRSRPARAAPGPAAAATASGAAPPRPIGTVIAFPNPRPPTSQRH